MALTKNFRRTGRAGAIELQETKEYVRAAQERARKEFGRRWWLALASLQALDPDWEKWYDERPEQTAGEMLPLIEQRVQELELATVEDWLDVADLYDRRADQDAELGREDARERADLWNMGHGR